MTAACTTSMTCLSMNSDGKGGLKYWRRSNIPEGAFGDWAFLGEIANITRWFLSMVWTIEHFKAVCRMISLKKELTRLVSRGERLQDLSRIEVVPVTCAGRLHPKAVHTKPFSSYEWHESTLQVMAWTSFILVPLLVLWHHAPYGWVSITVLHSDFLRAGKELSQIV